MNNEDLQTSINLIKIGDKKKALFILSELVKKEPNNELFWLWLSACVESDEQRIFCLRKVKLINPNNPQVNYSLAQLEEITKNTKINQIISTSDNIANSPTSTNDETYKEFKKCPYCAEDIKLDAIVCRFCGHDLSTGSPQENNQKKIEMSAHLAELEKNKAGWERYLQEQFQIAQNEGTGSRIIWIIIGLLLSPFIVGIIIIILAVLDILVRNSKRREAESNQSKARYNIEVIQKQIVDVKTELSLLY